MIRAQPFMLVIGHLESALELVIERHDVMRLGDLLELSAHQARLSSSGLESSPCSGYPSTLAGKIFA